MILVAQRVHRLPESRVLERFELSLGCKGLQRSGLPGTLVTFDVGDAVTVAIFPCLR